MVRLRRLNCRASVVGRVEVHDFLDKIVDRSAPTVANRMLPAFLCMRQRRLGLRGVRFEGASVNAQTQMGKRMASVDRIASSARVVLITGATSGIGKACAERLAGAGWWVFRSRARRGSDVGGGQSDRNDHDGCRRGGVSSRWRCGGVGQGGSVGCRDQQRGSSMRSAVEDTTIEAAKAQF